MISNMKCLANPKNDLITNVVVAYPTKESSWPPRSRACIAWPLIHKVLWQANPSTSDVFPICTGLRRGWQSLLVCKRFINGTYKLIRRSCGEAVLHIVSDHPIEEWREHWDFWYKALRSSSEIRPNAIWAYHLRQMWKQNSIQGMLRQKHTGHSRIHPHRCPLDATVVARSRHKCTAAVSHPPEVSLTHRSLLYHSALDCSRGCRDATSFGTGLLLRQRWRSSDSLPYYQPWCPVSRVHQRMQEWATRSTYTMDYVSFVKEYKTLQNIFMSV